MSLDHGRFFCQQSKPGVSEADDIAIDSESCVLEPDLYRVLLHNDDYTSMEFVVEILQDIFNQSQDSAKKIMLDVHTNGVGVCGIFPYEVAETKLHLVEKAARSLEYPLKCSLEKN